MRVLLLERENKSMSNTIRATRKVIFGFVTIMNNMLLLNERRKKKIISIQTSQQHKIKAKIGIKVIRKLYSKFSLKTDYKEAMICWCESFQLTIKLLFETISSVVLWVIFKFMLYIVLEWCVGFQEFSKLQCDTWKRSTFSRLTALNLCLI